MKLEELKKKIFEIRSDSDFNEIVLKIFHYQYANNPVYQQYINLNKWNIEKIDHFQKIPFLPIEFFKSHKIICRDTEPEKIFKSSGTNGTSTSKHYVTDLSLYEKSFLTCFEMFYGSPDQFLIFALLPSYLERKDSSLVYMIEKLIILSKNPGSGFYLNNFDQLAANLSANAHQKILLIGVTFALLEFIEKYEIPLFNGLIMETGGMKGRRMEIIREELHLQLASKFHTAKIHSEYGMTELLSQGYSDGDGIFKAPPWMKILIRDTNDPKSLLGDDTTGGINVIDLANLYSCSFIATQDLGKTKQDGSFEVLGRFDNSDIRGCNLML
jgi:phenylacetate-coenzyme A ligase PaaK-like adenylate-forming protein